jgi:hypothetical protein
MAPEQREAQSQVSSLPSQFLVDGDGVFFLNLLEVVYPIQPSPTFGVHLFYGGRVGPPS